MELRRRAHDWSLVLCAATFAYLLQVVLTARLAGWLVRVLGESPSVAGRVLLGTLGLDLAKAPALLGAAWLLARLTQLAPLTLALGVTLLCFGLEAAVVTILQQAPWLLGEPLVLLCRGLAAALLVLLATLVARCERRPRGA
jgi:hypothetical protein